MRTLATRLDKIEAQTNDTERLAQGIITNARGLVMGGEKSTAEYTADLRTARDQLAVIASPYDVNAQYWLNVAAVMLGELEAPRLSRL